MKKEGRGLRPSFLFHPEGFEPKNSTRHAGRYLPDRSKCREQSAAAPGIRSRCSVPGHSPNRISHRRPAQHKYRRACGCRNRYPLSDRGKSAGRGNKPSYRRKSGRTNGLRRCTP